MWFVATLMIRCQVGEQATPPWTIQEQVRLINAPDEESAYQRALEISREAEHSYANAAGERVSWHFLGLDDLEWVFAETLVDGIEVRTRFNQVMDPASQVLDKDELTVFKPSYQP